MEWDKATVMFDEGEITLWDVTEDEDGNITGTHVDGDFPMCEELVIIPADKVIAVY